MKEKGLPLFILLALLTLTFCATFNERNSDAEAQPWLNNRLPSYIVPEHYDILFNLPLEGNSFKGTVAITVSVKEPSNVIIVHANGLTISKTEVKSDEESVPVEETFSHEPNQYWIIRLSKEISIGEYVIFFEFEGTYTSGGSGLTKRSYWNEELKQESFIIASIFQETNARTAFPCFDELTFRAEFSIRIVHENSHFPLSNTPVKKIKNMENKLMETTFEKTLPMPPYLVGIFVSDFKYQEIVNQGGVKIRVYSPASSLDKVDYTLKTASKLVTYFEEYFGIPYPLPKLDIISIPAFGWIVGNNENWGLILCSENKVLWDKETSILGKEQVLNTLPFEIAHMWIGSLVTLKSWNDVWLKMGLATYLSNKALQRIEQIENLENRFVGVYNLPTIDLDGKIDFSPIVSPMTTTEDAQFNIIVFAVKFFKSGTIIRMLEKFMGEDFRKGLTTYLRKYYLSNAGREEFYAEMSAASRIGLNISSIMDTWTKQKNFPYITVEHDEEGNYAVQQHRYLEDPSIASLDKQPSVYNYVWQIPLTYRTAELKENDVIMLKTPEKVTLTLPKSDWMKFNVNSTGCYLVNYEEKDWAKFSTLLQRDLNVFDPTERLSFVLDSLYLASAGIVSYEAPLNISLYLKKETEDVPWYITKVALFKLFQKLGGEIQVAKLLLKHYGSLAKDLFRKYTWENTGNFAERKLRQLLIEFACGGGDKECLRTALGLLKDWMKGIDISTKVESLGKVLFYGAQAEPSNETFNYLWQRLKDEHDGRLKDQILSALAHIENKTLLKRLMTLAADENIINPGAYFLLLRRITWSSHIGQKLVCNFIITNWSALNQRFGANEVEKFGADMFGFTNTEKGLKKIENFYNTHPQTESYEKRKEALDKIRENINWLHRHKKTILNWLLSHVNKK